jgi:hypothetical protein
MVRASIRRIKGIKGVYAYRVENSKLKMIEYKN